MLSSRPHILASARATVLGCALVLGGCTEVGEVLAVAEIDDATQAVMAANLLSINGTYGTGPTACAGHGASAPWSLEIAVGATLTHPELSVMRGDSTCVLTFTSLVADQTYAASPAFALTTSYQVTASSFTAGSVTFYASARLDSTAFSNDFAMTILASSDPGAGIGDGVTARGPGKLHWTGDADYFQGALETNVPTMALEATSSFIWRAATADTCGVRTDGSLWCWGENVAGQVGIGNLISPQWRPVQVGSVLTWKAVTSGASHVCATRTDFTLWCWGNNSYGQLGRGDTITPQQTPIQIPGTTWATVSADTDHTCATTSDGKMWCWGRNDFGQIGNGNTTTPQPSPVQVGTAIIWRSVSADGNHTCATRTNGTFWCWGSNDKGQVGIGTQSTWEVPVQVGILTTWTAVVSTGVDHTCGTRTGGGTKLWCWGGNASGQLGSGSAGSPVTSPVQIGAITTWSAISAGNLATCATRSGGTLWCWGRNLTGQLGTGTYVDQSSPFQVDSGTTWNGVATSLDSTCATRTDGSRWCWGGGALGQLGTGDRTNRLVATPVGTLGTWIAVATGLGHTCATRTDGTLWCWGLNTSGQVGINTLVNALGVPVQVGILTTWNRVAAGNAHSCATRNDGTLWCWGENAVGQLGINSVVTPQMVPVQEIGGASWEEVGAGHAFACATRTNGTLWCWGENAVGQVGINSVATPQMAPVQVGSATWKVLAVGGYHACGIQSDGTLWCWGANGSGQVATGSTSVSVNSPDQVGSLTTWMHVSAGLYHTCATRTDGTLWCWGSDDNSQTGTGGAQVNPVQVGVLTTWKSVTLGSRHSCATRTTRWVYCWGRNAEGQLGLGNAYDASPQPNPVHVSWLPPSFASLGVFSSSSANSTFFILPSS